MSDNLCLSTAHAPMVWSVATRSTVLRSWEGGGEGMTLFFCGGQFFLFYLKKNNFLGKKLCELLKCSTKLSISFLTCGMLIVKSYK